jgi:hypothetical protein
VRTPETAQGEKTSARPIDRPTKVWLTISASARPNSSCSPTSTKTHWALKVSVSQNCGSSVKAWTKLSKPAKPLRHGLVGL